MRRLARVFRMDDEAWRRRANPWGVWTRFTALPALVLAVRSRGWTGWWALGPVAVVVVWLLLKPHVFPPAAAPHGWAANGIHGERPWFQEPDRVRSRHRRALRWLALPAFAGAALLRWGLARLSPWQTVLGGTVVALAHLARIRRLGRLHDEIGRADPSSRGA